MTAGVADIRLSQKKYSDTELSQKIGALASTLQKIAQLFADIFAAPPWNEYKVCSNYHYFGKKDAELICCSHCNEPLELAYPPESVIDQILEEAGNKKGGCLTLFEDEEGSPRAVGWGFACSADELGAKYTSAEMREKGLKEVERYLKEGNAFYISEVLVSPEMRGQGLATKITNTLVERARELHLNVVLHTHCDSPMAKIAKKIGMLPILNQGEDTEIPGRIFFARVL